MSKHRREVRPRLIGVIIDGDQAHVNIRRSTVIEGDLKNALIIDGPLDAELRKIMAKYGMLFLPALVYTIIGWYTLSWVLVGFRVFGLL
jgi:hypothetical protein